jgi:hypothetical protein
MDRSVAGGTGVHASTLEARSVPTGFDLDRT